MIVMLTLAKQSTASSLTVGVSSVMRGSGPDALRVFAVPLPEPVGGMVRERLQSGILPSPLCAFLPRVACAGVYV